MGQHFGKVHGFTVGKLADLLAATETVSHHHGQGTGGFDGGQKAIRGNGFRDGELLGFKAKRTGHAAATGLDRLHTRAGLLQHGNLGCRSSQNGLLMAVAVYQDMRPFKSADKSVGYLGGEPVRQQPCLAVKLPGSRIVGEKLQHLVLEDAGATWLQKDERAAGSNLRSHAVQYPAKIFTRVIEKAEVVKR